MHDEPVSQSSFSHIALFPDHNGTADQISRTVAEPGVTSLPPGSTRPGALLRAASGLTPENPLQFTHLLSITVLMLRQPDTDPYEAPKETGQSVE